MTEPIAPPERLDLLPVPAAAGEARRFVEGFCRDAWLDDDVSATAVLLTSELVTNAIIHGRTPSVLQVSSPPGLLRVLVRDDNPTSPVPGHPGPDRPGGRGLLLVELMSSAWGFEPFPGGKSVWFEMQV